jgi:hypothetical protein
MMSSHFVDGRNVKRAPRVRGTVSRAPRARGTVSIAMPPRGERRHAIVAPGADAVDREDTKVSLNDTAKDFCRQMEISSCLIDSWSFSLL